MDVIDSIILSWGFILVLAVLVMAVLAVMVALLTSTYALINLALLSLEAFPYE